MTPENFENLSPRSTGQALPGWSLEVSPDRAGLYSSTYQTKTNGERSERRAHLAVTGQPAIWPSAAASTTIGRVQTSAYNVLIDKRLRSQRPLLDLEHRYSTDVGYNLGGQDRVSAAARGKAEGRSRTRPIAPSSTR